MTVIESVVIVVIMTTATAAKAPIVIIAYVTQAPAARSQVYQDGQLGGRLRE